MRRVAPEGSLRSNSFEGRIAAKLLRDQTLSRIAHAEVKLEEGDPATAEKIVTGTENSLHPRGFGSRSQISIDQAVTLASRVGPGNVDLPKLQRMSDELSAKLKAQGFDPARPLRNPLSLDGK